MLITGYVIAALVAAAIIVIGLRYLIAPAPSAASFGVPMDQAEVDALAAAGRGGPGRSVLRQFTDVKGVRDITSGLVVLPFVIGGHPTALAAVLLAEAFTPLGDMTIVLRHGGSRVIAFGVHLATAVVMVIAAGLLLAGS